MITRKMRKTFVLPVMLRQMRDQERKVYNKKNKRPSIPRKHSIWTDIADMCLEKVKRQINIKQIYTSNLFKGIKAPSTSDRASYAPQGR